MNTVHLQAIFRADDPGTAQETWSGYSFPISIYVGGATLDEAMAELQAATRVAAPGDIFIVQNHIEWPLAPGIYIRAAQDLADRTATVAEMRKGLLNRAQLEDFLQAMPVSASGDIVIVACQPEDRLGWVSAQMGPYDALVVCLLDTETLMPTVNVSYLLGAKAPYQDESTLGAVGTAGLSRKSTIQDLFQALADSGAAIGPSGVLVDSLA